MIMTHGLCQVTQTRYGSFLSHRLDRYIGASLALYGEYSQGEVDLFKQCIRQGDVVVDAGANIGYFSVIFSQLVGAQGAVYAFEAHEFIYNLLCGNAAFNSCFNLHPYFMALGNTQTTIEITLPNYTITDNFGGIDLMNHHRSGTTQSVQCDTLDNVLSPLERVDFIKIDVEGMEQVVIEGARQIIKKFRPLLYVENDRTQKARYLLELLEQLEYTLFEHNPPLYNPQNFLGCSENIFRFQKSDGQWGYYVSKNILCIPKERSIEMKGFKQIYANSYA